MLQRLRQTSLRGILDVISIVGIILASGVVVWGVLRAQGRGGALSLKSSQQTASRTKGAAPSIPQQPISIEGATTRGNSSAAVAIIEFSDFQCTFCARFVRDIYPSILKQYVDSGRVLLAFRHLPLEKLHPLAVTSAQMAVCAAGQGKFWEVHDAFFAKAQDLKAASDYKTLAVASGISADKLDGCLSTKTPGAQVKRDLDEATGLGLHSTPAFLVGSLEGSRVSVSDVIVGAQPVEVFQKKLDAAIAKIR